MHPRTFSKWLSLAGLADLSRAVTVTESSTAYSFSNDKISFDVAKGNGYLRNIVSQGVNLLGTATKTTGNVYTDFPSKGFIITGAANASVYKGDDWAGIVLLDDSTSVGSLVERSWFLRDGESGIHSFVRLDYYNTSVDLPGLGEVRTMFRPNGGPWTHIITNSEQWAPILSAEATAKEVVVQDATWYVGNSPAEAYVKAEGDYWTKYTFADNQTNKAHGLYGHASDGHAVGAWWVVNQKDTFFGGPAHPDLMVDGIIYNKLSTGHGGATSPNVTSALDRTFGPQFLYFNHGSNTTGLQDLLADAESYADPSWDSDFYDEIGQYVPGYAPSNVRGTFVASVKLPKGATKPVAVLSANGYPFQDSAFNPKAYQYWGDVVDGAVTIPRVKAGTYRLTVYATGVFGDYTRDDVEVRAGHTKTVNVDWEAESSGKELWRIGTPDKTAGEFRNGWERDYTRTNTPAKYRIYWGAWDFPTQFPKGVNFTIGQSQEAVDWNYIHWSRYGPTYTRAEAVLDVNEWQINFNVSSKPSASSTATFTIQLAGVHSTSGNKDSSDTDYSSFPLTTYVNGRTNALNWTLPYYDSGSCGARSAISCHLVSTKLTFPGTWLQKGQNFFVLSIPYNQDLYVQYDALRLELA